MSGHTIGMWMYKNGGGHAIQQQIMDQLRQRDITVINNLDLNHAIAQNGQIMCHGIEMESLDLYFPYNAGQQTDYQVYLYQKLDMSVQCINSFASFSLTEDKFATSHLLNRHGLTTPDYQLCHRDDIVSVKSILRHWGGRAVYKPTDGWGGMGIVKIENEAAIDMLIPFLNQTNMRYFYLERLIDYDNTDFRVDIVNGQVVGCYGRRAPLNDWKTNISNGGSIILREPNEQVVNLALRAAAITGLDIAGVDLLYDREREQYVVLEVNGIPAFATPEQELIGLDFNQKKIAGIVTLIENKVKGINDVHVFAKEVA
ncbi:MAG: ATP-grasp domain-containing protein [Gammaproteobacteria bacterium]|nr:ATP-grasp domain-containing protein [Gammaproteobacteria bacterium]